MSAIDITTHSTLWQSMDKIIKNAVTAALNKTNKTGEISIVLADNEFIQDLNKAYRGKDKPTNVLSFPQDEDQLLGDVILAYETIHAEAQQQNKSFEHHVTHLVVHGTLHLFGYDHETEAEAEKMETLEVEILAELGVKNPYQI